MVDVSEIARFTSGERTLRLDETQGGKKKGGKKSGKKTVERHLDLGHWEVIEKA